MYSITSAYYEYVLYNLSIVATILNLQQETREVYNGNGALQVRETGLRTVPLDPNRLDLIRRAVLAEAESRRAAKPGAALDPLAFAWLEPARVRQVGARHGCSLQGPYCGVPSYFPIAKYLPYALLELS